MRQLGIAHRRSPSSAGAAPRRAPATCDGMRTPWPGRIPPRRAARSPAAWRAGPSEARRASPGPTPRQAQFGRTARRPRDELRQPGAPPECPRPRREGAARPTSVTTGTPIQSASQLPSIALHGKRVERDIDLQPAPERPFARGVGDRQRQPFRCDPERIEPLLHRSPRRLGAECPTAQEQPGVPARLQQFRPEAEHLGRDLRRILEASEADPAASPAGRLSGHRCPGKRLIAQPGLRHALYPLASECGKPGRLYCGRSPGDDQGPAARRVPGKVDQDVDAVGANPVGGITVGHRRKIAAAPRHAGQPLQRLQHRRGVRVAGHLESGFVMVLEQRRQKRRDGAPVRIRCQVADSQPPRLRPPRDAGVR